MANTLCIGIVTLALVCFVACGASPQQLNHPVHGRIAFVSDRDGNPEIYVMNADGTDLTRLTDTPGAEREPVWSPDGQRIAFLYGDIYVMNADGTDRTQITDTSAGKENIAWSPDGQRIVFAAKETSNARGWVIYVVNADGTDLTRLTDTIRMALPETRSFGPAATEFPSQIGWSPDSRRIAFPSTGNIYSMRADEAYPYTRLLANGVQPTWSPDGHRIAFVRNRDIYVMNADGSGETRLTYNPRQDENPAWSPDSQRIAFRSYREDGYAIYVMNVDGTDQIRLTNRGGSWLELWLSDFGTGAGSLDWSPDGRHITFFSYFRLGLDNFDTEILVMNVDGTGITRLTHDRANAVSPSWSPQ